MALPNSILDIEFVMLLDKYPLGICKSKLNWKILQMLLSITVTFAAGIEGIVNTCEGGKDTEGIIEVFAGLEGRRIGIITCTRGWT